MAAIRIPSTPNGDLESPSSVRALSGPGVSKGPDPAPRGSRSPTLLSVGASHTALAPGRVNDRANRAQPMIGRDTPSRVTLRQMQTGFDSTPRIA
ncbi:MAG: hypothetical protein IPK72_19755 [Candidatus Eisenbacteria bacterium]|nr:hypothetical protein [Candidatus Eisenbacteria bacterium]